MSARVSIPGNVRRMIQDIKEIAGNHGDDEVYAVLKECSMDPNETAQRLLLEDTFHEVKRKRDKRKESNKESTDSRWRPGAEGKGGRGGRVNYSSRNIANDTSSGRSVNAGRENGAEKVNANTPLFVHDAEIKSRIPSQSSVGALANGTSNVKSSFSSQGSTSHVPDVNCVIKTEEIFTAKSNKTGTTMTSKISESSQPVPVSSQVLSSKTAAYTSEVYSSASDPVLAPNLDVCAPGVVGTTKSEVETQSAVGKTVNKVVSLDAADSELSSIDTKDSSEMGNNYMHGKLQGKSPRNEANQLLDTPQQMPSSSLAASISSRPSFNHSSRSQQLSAPHKAGPNKEWKPKTSHASTAHTSAMPVTSEIISVTVEAVDHSVPTASSTASEDGIPKLQKKLEGLYFADTRHVIIPNHLQVPESERSGLSFGNFDGIFGLGTSFVNDPNSDKCSTQLSESSQEIDENVEQCPSGQVAPPTVQEASYLDDLQSSALKSENLPSREADVSSGGSAVQECDQSKPKPTLATEVPRHSIVQTAPTYPTFDLTPQMLGGQFAAFEGTENQPRDASRFPSFVAQQTFDPSSFYTQFYRPPIDGDGHFSPFLAPGAATKYNGNFSVLPAQTGQSPQEGGNPMVLSSTGPTLAVSQATGVMQSSNPNTQQPVPVFRQPAGVHITHYHPNYIPYNQYISPFFVQPATTLHPFLSSTAFPQQPPTGGIFTPPPAATSPNPLKYTMAQFKPGSNTGNSTHVGMPTGYGAYNSTPAGYSPNPSGTSGNSNSNEDLTASQFKESSVYMTGQQSDGSAVWFATPGHDIPGLQASSFYNLPPHQHLSFATSQAGHGAYPGIYHPTQTVSPTAVHPLLPQSQPLAGAIEMVGPPAGVYQQPQRAPINWANNY
ncbi:hypothetical protein J5N97_008068 [Dioscorea zingiberensis]|uniref:GBF-interacting protein 1 N-terminal domain-containing protein n=1 Tax=Dioscorea zingiberensis TaxID=325984 RepID=A0A9D5DH54_9LILI|nr:hypothetical protein J5N97_008068 [Dioscorea zingiberensis]